MRIGIDLDGCVVDMMSTLKVSLSKDEDPCFFDLEECWGYSTPGVQDMFRNQVSDNELFLNANMHKGARSGLLALKTLGHSLHIVTARHHLPTGVSQTVQWLSHPGRNLFGMFDSFTFAGDKTIVDVDVLIEDRLDTCEAMIRKGVQPILMNRPWNDPTYCCSKHQHVTNDDKFNVDYRVHSWSDAVQFVKRMTNER